MPGGTRKGGLALKGKEKFVSIENKWFKSYVGHDDYSCMVKTSVRFRNPFKKGIIPTAVKMTALLIHVCCAGLSHAPTLPTIPAPQERLSFTIDNTHYGPS